MTSKSAYAAAVLLLCTLACGGAHEQDAAAGRAEGLEAQMPTNRIDVSPTVRRNLGITFAQVEVRHVAQTIRVPGAFELRPLARHEYRMALPGRVELLVDQFDAVEPGQPIFRFQSPAWPELLHEIILGEQAIETATAEIAVVVAQIAETQRKLELIRERIAALVDADFKNADLETQAAALEASVPRLEAELHLARTSLSNARRTREHALHRAATASGIPEGRLEEPARVGDSELPTYLTVDWIEVRAVESGVVERLAVTDGAFVESPTMVLSTVDPEQVRFRALGLQGDLARISESSEVSIVPPQSRQIPIGDSVPATMTFGLEAHPEERTMVLFATPTQLAPWIRPGVSAFLEIVVDSTEEPALAVPRSAVVRDGLDHILFRRDPADPNAVLRIEADLGVSDGRWVVLQSGVMRGDEVVLDGAYELKLAGAGPPESGHLHADGSAHDDH